MKKALIGYGGFAREIQAHMQIDLIFFVDDQYWTKGNKSLLPLASFDPNEYELLIAIGNPKDRFNIANRHSSISYYFR